MGFCHRRGTYYLFLTFLLLQLIISQPAYSEFIAEGVVLTPLTTDGKSTAVSWAYQGDLVTYLCSETGTQRQLMIMKSDGSEKEKISQMGNPFFAEWSWNSNKISFEFSNSSDRQSQGGIYVYDLNTKKTTSISAPYPQSSIDYTDGPFWSVDDKFLAYKVRPDTSGKYQVFVANAETGKYERILVERGQSQEQRWSLANSSKLCLLTEAGGGGYDVATVNNNGKELNLLTDNGGRSIDVDSPRWSPSGEWIAFTSDIDMTQTERDIAGYYPRCDCWISRPDGSEARNLTKASSSATEEQLCISALEWSWDSRWILGRGSRFDNQGNGIGTIYLIDPINGGYEPIITSDPSKKGEIDFISLVKWSYDSQKILILSTRYGVKNWGRQAQYENTRSLLSIYDVSKKNVEDILIYNEQSDLAEITGSSFGLSAGRISWSPDNRSILLTIAEIISRDDNINKPDVYRLDLPSRFISPIAAKHIGPPIGRTVSVVAAAELVEESNKTSPDLAVEPVGEKDLNGDVTVTLKPIHMTIEEAIKSLPSAYGQYFTTNTARNLILFKGPAGVLAEFRKDLEKVDTPPPHIMVDLLAVELSEEANQKLGLDWTYTEDKFAFYQPAGRAIQQSGGAQDALNLLSDTGQSFYQGVGKLPNEFFIRLNSLVTEGQGTILANPRTVAMSGKESLINIRKTLNYFYDEGFDVSGRPIVRKSDISADTEGRIVPTLLADGTINLVVDVKVGNYTFTPDAGLPELTTRQSTTEVTVQEGQTLVLGGLREQQITTATTKVPLLSDIPIIGNLFKHEEKTVKKSVLTIFITPHILISEEPTPQWPQIDPNEHEMVPIMKD
ncbi:MAG: PD40 domain-containing protein [Sedimentisphaerales bacterium]|nr:PD40 domain-containing protein [Sedimentisphaerales bacterium]